MLSVTRVSNANDLSIISESNRYDHSSDYASFVNSSSFISPRNTGYYKYIV